MHLTMSANNSFKQFTSSIDVWVISSKIICTILTRKVMRRYNCINKGLLFDLTPDTDSQGYAKCIEYNEECWCWCWYLWCKRVKMIRLILKDMQDTLKVLCKDSAYFVPIDFGPSSRWWFALSFVPTWCLQWRWCKLKKQLVKANQWN